MKTLKKTLCLVLAVVMVVGVLVLPAGADFNDADEIQYKDAVAVLTGIGVIEGHGGTNLFAPDDTLTRAQAAKIIHYLVTTPEVAEDYGGTTSKYADVKPGNWAMPSIAYCDSKGIISGANGSFYPDEKLTGVAFAKMLLCSLGYDAENEKFVGDDWEANVENLAREKDLNSGIKGFDYSVEITREEAAQMAFNALKLNKVSYTGGTEVEVNGVTIRQGAVRNEREKTDLYSNVYNLGYNLNTTDNYGRPSRTWTSDGAPIAVLSVGYDKVYTTGTKYSTILKDLGYTVSEKVDVTVYTDGKFDDVTYEDMTRKALTSEAGYVEPAEEPAAKAAAFADAIGGTGVLVEAYNIDDGVVSLVVVNTYVAKLADANIQAAKDATDNSDAISAGVIFNNWKGEEGISAFYKTTDFAKDDVVIFNVAHVDEDVYTITSMEKVTTVPGTVTGVANDNSYFRVDGDKKVVAKEHLESANTIPTPSSETTYNFYLDTYGNVVGYDKIDGPAAPAPVYAYLLRYNEKAPGDAYKGSLFDDENKAATNAAAKAQLVFLDTGVTDVVDIAVVQSNGRDGGEKGTWYLADAYGKPDTKNKFGTSANNNRFAANSFVSYIPNDDGTYVLTSVAEETDPANVVVKEGKADITRGDSKKSTVYANAGTVLTVVTAKSSGYTVESYTSYKNFVALNNTANNISDAMFLFDKGVVTKLIVVINKETTVVEEDTSIRAIFLGKGETTLDGTAYNFIVDGVETSYYGLKSTLAFEANKVYNITLDEEGLILEEEDGPAENKGALNKVGTLSFVDQSFIVVDGVPYYLADGCVFFNSETGKIVDKLPDVAEMNVTVYIYQVNPAKAATDENAAQLNLVVIVSATDKKA